jgi:integrase
VFGLPFGDYRAARRMFTRSCLRAGLHKITLHDLRHTFAVHAAQSGVPIPRIQKLLGHATVAMAMRYMKHAPEAYFAEDAAKVAGSLTGDLDREQKERVTLARQGVRRLDAS